MKKIKAYIAIDVLTGLPARFMEGFAVYDDKDAMKGIVNNATYSDGSLCYGVIECEIKLVPLEKEKTSKVIKCKNPQCGRKISKGREYCSNSHCEFAPKKPKNISHKKVM